MEERSRASIIATSLAGQSGIVITRDVAEGVRFADEFAPEHMCLATENPEQWQGMVTHAGGLFIGDDHLKCWVITSPGRVTPCPPAARRVLPRP